MAVSHPTNHRPILIGLTGGIASGKSTAANHFDSLGVPLIDADQVARDLVLPGQPALKEILDLWPDAGDLETGLNRQYLREMVFNDDDARHELESILHPAIRAKMFSRALSLTDHYVVLEIPLLVENGLQSYVDRVLVIDVSVETQIARATRRDGGKPKLIKALIATQATREERLAQAHDVIVNESDELTLKQCVEQLHQLYNSLNVESITQYPSIKLP